MQRFGNLKVGSVFGFLHPEIAISVFGIKKNYFFLEIWKLKLRFWFLVWKQKTGVRAYYYVVWLRHTYYVVVGTDTLLQQKKSVRFKTEFKRKYKQIKIKRWKPKIDRF